MDGPNRDAGTTTDAASSNVVQAYYDWTTTTPSVAVIETLARTVGHDPTTYWMADGARLTDFVDADALDRLFESGAGTVRSVEFDVDGYTVEVDGDGLVRVETPDLRL